MDDRILLRRSENMYAISNDCLSPCGFENGSMYTVTDADGNVYNTVRIGCDCWMAENLASTTYSDTTCGLSNSPIAVSLAYYAALYPDTVANVNTYGRLYSWYSAVGLPKVQQAIHA